MNDELWICEGKYNARRKAKETICLNCNQCFLQRLNGKQLFCCVKCGKESRSRLNTSQVECFNCKKKFRIRNSKLSISKFRIYFCGKDCKNFAQSFKGSDPNIRPAHFRKEQDLVKCKHCGSGIRKNNSLYCSNECRGKEKIKEVKQKMNNGERIIASTARKILITERGHRCEGCSNTHWLNKIIPLDMHHIDGNHLNNKEENLQLLCKNCHALTETYGSKNLGNGRYKRRIKFIEDKLKNSLV